MGSPRQEMLEGMWEEEGGRMMMEGLGEGRRAATLEGCRGGGGGALGRL